MASSATAPAQLPARTLVGPLSTQSGFQYWYLVCLPDSIIAVRLGIRDFFAFGLSNGAVAPVFGLVGALINILVAGSATKHRERKEAMLQRTGVGVLRSKPNVVYSVSQLTAIRFKESKNGGNLILPDVTLELSNGKKQKFSCQRAEFEKTCSTLKQMYPSLCR